jgi:hypothetical protein
MKENLEKVVGFVKANPKKVAIVAGITVATVVVLIAAKNGKTLELPKVAKEVVA